MNIFIKLMVVLFNILLAYSMLTASSLLASWGIYLGLGIASVTLLVLAYKSFLYSILDWEWLESISNFSGVIVLIVNAFPALVVLFSLFEFATATDLLFLFIISGFPAPLFNIFYGVILLSERD